MSWHGRVLGRSVRNARGSLVGLGVSRMRLTFPSALLLLFIGLKLYHVIMWSWWWITSPIWVFFVFAFVYVLFQEIRRVLRG